MRRSSRRQSANSAPTGFDSPRMDGIATARAVSKRTAYNHFPSKEDLIAAIVAEPRDRCDFTSEYADGPGMTRSWPGSCR